MIPSCGCALHSKSVTSYSSADAPVTASAFSSAFTSVVVSGYISGACCAHPTVKATVATIITATNIFATFLLMSQVSRLLYLTIII